MLLMKSIDGFQFDDKVIFDQEVQAVYSNKTVAIFEFNFLMVLSE